MSGNSGEGADEAAEEAADPAAHTSVRLLFVDEGSYRTETVRIPVETLGRYDRLIDCLREEPSVLRRLHVDLGRLCSAAVVEDGDDEGEVEGGDGDGDDDGDDEGDDD